MPAWEQELAEDPDKEFLLQGIANGFDIIDDDVVISPVSAENHPSAKPSSKLYGKASKQILTEIELGNYVICDSPPEIVSPIAVIPKPDGDVRLIHDCSRPIGNAVNDYLLYRLETKIFHSWRCGGSHDGGLLLRKSGPKKRI